MIVKVQISLVTTEKDKQVLVYNKSKTVVYQDIASPTVLEFMGDDLKAYCEAYISGQGEIRLIEKVKPQNW